MNDFPRAAITFLAVKIVSPFSTKETLVLK